MIYAALSEKRWVTFILLILVGLIQSLAFLILVYLAKRFVESGSYQLTSLQFVVLLGLILVVAGGRFAERFVAEKFALNYVRHLRQQIYEYTLQLPVSERDALNRGNSLLRITNDMSAIRNWFVQGLAPLLVLSVWLITGFSGLVTVHWGLGVVLLLCLVAMVVGNILIGRLLYRASEQARNTRAQLIRSAVEKLRQFYLITAFNQKGKEKRRFGKRSYRLMQKQMNKGLMSALLRGFNEGVLLMTFALLFICALYLQGEGVIDMQSVAMLLTASLYLLSQMRRLSRLYEIWTLYTVARDKLLAFLSRFPGVEDGRRTLPKGPLQVELRNVSVKGRIRPIAAQLDLHSRVVLTGAPGNGKSSLLLVMSGLLPIDSGKLVFNARDSKKFHSVLWSRTASLVSPELPLLRGSVRFNLFYGARHKDGQYTEEVLRLTEIAPDELDRVILEEEGRNLSDGYKLRLKLARALLRRPKLLLIDREPSLMDPSVVCSLQRVFQRFPGAIVISCDIPELAEFVTDYWELENMGEDASVLVDQKANILPFPSKAGSV